MLHGRREQVKYQKKSVAATLYDCKVAPSNAVRKLKQKESELLALLGEYKWMEQDQKDIAAQKEQLYRPTDEVITNDVMSEVAKGSKTDG